MRAQRLLRGCGHVLRFLVLAALALEALYVFAINVFLSTSLFEKVIDATPDVVDIHYARGWSLFPTRVHARKLSIRGADSHIEWILRLDEVEFDCSLLALLRQEFRVTMAHGSGITFRARFKVASPAATSELGRETPSIDSLGPVGFLPNEAPYAGIWDDTKWHLWTVSIHGANAEHVRDVWIERARFTGDAHITGGFYLKPIRSVEVGPIAVGVDAGSVAVDSKIVADHIVAAVDVALSRFDPRTTAPVLRLLSLSTDASLEVPNLANLGLVHGDDQEISGEVAIPRVALRVANGVLGNGSVIHANAPAISVHTAMGGASAAVDVTGEVEHDHLVTRVVVEHIDTSLSAEAPRLTVALDSGELALDAPFGDLHALVDLPDAHMGDASRLSALLPSASPVRVLGGELRGSLHGEAWGREARLVGSVQIGGHALDLTTAQLRAHGDATLEASVRSFQIDTHVATGLLATLVLPEAWLAPAAVPAELFVRVVGLRGRAEASELDLAHPLRSFKADVAIPDLELYDRESARAALGVARGLRFVSRRARLDVSAQLDVEGSRVGATLDAHGSDVGVEYAGATGSAAALEGRIAGQIRDGIVQGTGSVALRGFGVMGAKVHVGGDARATVDVARWDLAKQVIDGTAHVALGHVHGGFAPEAKSPDFVAQSLALGASVSSFDIARPSLLGVRYEASVKAAELLDARALNVLLPSSEILAIESGRAYGSLGASGDARGSRGFVEVRLAEGGLVLGETHFVGDVELAARAGRSTPASTEEAPVVDLEGSHLAMRHVRVTGASTDTSDWAGDFMVESGRLRLRPTPTLEADVTLRATDANPILGLLFRDTLSPFVAGLTRMPSFTAVTHVKVEPRELVVSDLVATGGSLSVRGTLALRPRNAGGPDGAFVVHKGPWSVGFNVDSLGAHLRLFGLDGWYQARALEVTQPRTGPVATP